MLERGEERLFRCGTTPAGNLPTTPAEDLLAKFEWLGGSLPLVVPSRALASTDASVGSITIPVPFFKSMKLAFRRWLKLTRESITPDSDKAWPYLSMLFGSENCPCPQVNREFNSERIVRDFFKVTETGGPPQYVYTYNQVGFFFKNLHQSRQRNMSNAIAVERNIEGMLEIASRLGQTNVNPLIESLRDGEYLERTLFLIDALIAVRIIRDNGALAKRLTKKDSSVREEALVLAGLLGSPEAQQAVVRKVLIMEKYSDLYRRFFEESRSGQHRVIREPRPAGRYPKGKNIFKRRRLDDVFCIFPVRRYVIGNTNDGNRICELRGSCDQKPLRDIYQAQVVSAHDIVDISLNNPFGRTSYFVVCPLADAIKANGIPHTLTLENRLIWTNDPNRSFLCKNGVVIAMVDANVSQDESDSLIIDGGNRHVIVINGHYTFAHLRYAIDNDDNFSRKLFSLLLNFSNNLEYSGEREIKRNILKAIAKAIFEPSDEDLLNRELTVVDALKKAKETVMRELSNTNGLEKDINELLFAINRAITELLRQHVHTQAISYVLREYFEVNTNSADHTSTNLTDRLENFLYRINRPNEFARFQLDFFLQLCSHLLPFDPSSPPRGLSPKRVITRNFSFPLIVFGGKLRRLVYTSGMLS